MGLFIGDSPRWMLFVRGNTARSASAIRAVRSACSAQSGLRAPALRVVDVFQEPALAAEYKVVATPTLVARGCVGERRWVGEVSEAQLLDVLQENGGDG
jgi:KaiB-like protein